MYDPLEFWETRAKDWIGARSRDEEDQVTKQEWQKIKGYINQNWRVLELGCGTGRWSPFFKNYTGVDISPTLLAEAKNNYPYKQFFHHDMRAGVPNGYDLIFTYTAWEHVPPEYMKIKLPNTNLLFVEPTGKSEVEYCFQHDYVKLFKVKPLKELNQLTIYGRFVD